MKIGRLNERIKNCRECRLWQGANNAVPPTYILPPERLLFESYGELKTGSFKLELPWSFRPQLYEFNSFEAFATSFRPSSKYTGLGTDGFLRRDVIITVV